MGIPTRILSLLAVLCMCGSARADVTISQYDANGDPVGSDVSEEAGQPFFLTVNSSAVRSILVRANPNLTETIGRITVTDDGFASNVRLYIAQEKLSDAQDAVFYSNPSLRACNNWNGLVSLRSAGNLLLERFRIISSAVRRPLVAPS